MAAESDRVVCSLRVIPSRMTSVQTPMMLSAWKTLGVYGCKLSYLVHAFGGQGQRKVEERNLKKHYTKPATKKTAGIT